MNIDLHCLVLNGVYRRTDAGPVFVEAPALTDQALLTVLDKINTRMMKLLTRRAVLVQEQESTYIADTDRDRTKTARSGRCRRPPARTVLRSADQAQTLPTIAGRAVSSARKYDS